MKQTTGEMHYMGVSEFKTRKADPLGPLVERYLLRGDEEAMDRLVERTRPKLLAVARRIGAPQDAEDAVQSAYVALVRKRGKSLDAPVMPWLLTTVIRLAYRRKAKQRRQRDLAKRLAEPHEPTQHGSALPSPTDAVLGAERDVLVRAAVASLPSRYRDPVVLRHLEGLSGQEAAALLDLPEATLRTRLHRAVKLLRSRVAPVLLASVMFLPWFVADAARRLVPLTRPWLGKPLLAATAIVVASVGTVLVSRAVTDTGATRSTSLEHRTSPIEGASQEDIPATGVTAPETASAETAEADETEPKDARTEPVIGVPPPPPFKTPADPGRARPSATHLPGTRLPKAGFSEVPGFQEIGVGQIDLPRPAGMVLMEGGYVSVGTDRDELATTLAGRPASIRALFAHEAPRHRVLVPSYWIGKYEVTNAQYARFLQDHLVSHTTQPNGLETLEAVAARLVGQTREAQKHPNQRVWRQLYEANRGAVWKAFSKADRNVLVFRKDHTVDEESTARACRREVLPAGLTLRFFRRAPPANWPGMLPPKAQLDHPVSYVSYNDAERFAEWAGLHVPTEPEWAWAARGPDGRKFPWGSTWFKDASRANWGGLRTDASHETTTLPVASLEAGRSWCGLHHMCGNVAEWTSSWFTAYPDSSAKPHAYMGRWVKVIRGGSAADGDPLVLRSAVRNFIGGGPKAPPFPENSFRFVGLRLAGYQQPGRDQVRAVVRRAAEGRRLKHGAMAPERFAAFVSHDWVKPDAPAANHVFVRGRSTGVVLIPATSLLRNESHPQMQGWWQKPAPLRKPKALLRRARQASPFFIAGVLHTDLPLEGVDVPDHAAARSQKKSKRRSKYAKPPSTRRGRCAPGTYLLTIWFDRVALTTPTLEFVCFLPEPGAKIPSVVVHPRSSKLLGSPTLRPSIEVDEGGLDFTVPLGGSRSPDKYVVRVRARLPYAKDAFHAVSAQSPWRRSTEGR